MKNTRPNPRGIFASMDEDSYQHLKKMFAIDQREARKQKHKKKRKGKIDHKTNRPGKSK